MSFSVSQPAQWLNLWDNLKRQLMCQPRREAIESGQRESTNQPSSILELNEEIRRLKAQVDELRRQNLAVVDHLIYAPGLEVQDEDYAHARSR